MNREFIGKKKFYLEDHPETFVIARMYVVETRQNEYFSAVLDNGDAFEVNVLDSPCEELAGVEGFMDLDNRMFIEYPTSTIPSVRFFDRKEKEIGVGEINVIDVRSQRIYVGKVTPTRSFKYKKNGWDFEAERGLEILVPMTKCFDMPLSKSATNCLVNDYFQIRCLIPNKL